MKNPIIYLVASLLVASAVFAVMHWVFHFNIIDAVMFGFIAAISEISAAYILRLFRKRKEKNSV